MQTGTKKQFGNIIRNEDRRKLDRPITGVIQHDRIWEQWYTEEAMRSDLPQMNQKDFMLKCNANYPNSVILNYRGKKKFTVKQLEVMIDQFSNILYYSYGIRKGDIISTIALSTPELVALKYACATIGAITCNLNFMDANHEDDKGNVLLEEIKLLNPKMIFILDILEDKVFRIINTSECDKIIKICLPLTRSTPFYDLERLVITALKVKNRINSKNIIASVPFRKFLHQFKQGKSTIESTYEPGLPCNIAFTSGTTGQNKAVLISHDANNALAYQHQLANLGLKRCTKHLALVPPFLAFWDADIIHTALCVGFENILELSLSYENIPKYVVKYLPQWGIWSQYLWDSILHLPPKKLKRVSANLDTVVVGGERCEINQAKSFFNLTGVVQSTGYGATEVDTCFSFTPPNCNVVGSAGIPFPFNNVRIVDSDFRDLTYNEPGRLLISSPCLMLGYYGNELLTKQALHRDEMGNLWYDTKDYAYIDENGCLFVLDRDNPPVEIKVGDHMETVKLLDIAEKIKVNRSIKICKLLEYKSKLILYVVLDEFYDIERNDAIESIKKTIIDSLPEKYYPDVIRLLDTLPRTAVGKVDYPKLNDDTAKIFQRKTGMTGKLNVVIQ